MNLFMDATFAGAASFLQADRDQPVAQQVWQVVYRERFEDNQVFEVRTTAVQMERSGFQVEFFEETVAVWDATSDEEAQLDCNTWDTWAMTTQTQSLLAFSLMEPDLEPGNFWKLWKLSGNLLGAFSFLVAFW